MSSCVRFRSSVGFLTSALACLAAASCAVPPAADRQDQAATQLHVTSSPSGARIILDGRPTGFRTPTVFPAAPGEHRVTISLADHRNADLRVRLEPGRTQRVEARLVPLATGTLALASLPAGAEIFVDGQPTGLRTPAAIGDLTVGTHTVELRRPGSEDWTQAVVVTQHRDLAVQAVLSPARGRVGALDVQSQPPRASISIDGRQTGRTTPARIAGLPAGSHRVELALQGYRPWSGSATIRDGQTEHLLVTLRRMPAQDVGGALIETDPPGAAITLDGVLLRQKTPAELHNLAPGAFDIRLSRPGARPWTGQIAVLPGKVTRLEISLQPQGGYGGSIRVESEPPGAAISVDGRPTGAATPALLPNLAPSGHRVTLELAGFRPWSQVAQVAEGSMETLRARLVPLPFAISASIAAERPGEIDVALRALRPDGTPAEGTLELDATSRRASWREARATLVDGRATAVLAPAPGATEISISVGLGSHRDVFVVRRTPGGWEIVTP